MPIRNVPLVSEAEPYVGRSASTCHFDSIIRVAGEDLPYGFGACYDTSDLSTPDSKIFLPDSSNATFFAGIVYGCRNQALERVDSLGRRIIPAGQQVILVYKTVAFWVPVEPATVPHPTTSVYVRKVADGNGVKGQFGTAAGTDFEIVKNTLWVGKLSPDKSKAQVNINQPANFI